MDAGTTRRSRVKTKIGWTIGAVVLAAALGAGPASAEDCGCKPKGEAVDALGAYKSAFAGRVVSAATCPVMTVRGK